MTVEIATILSIAVYLQNEVMRLWQCCGKVTLSQLNLNSVFFKKFIKKYFIFTTQFIMTNQALMLNYVTPGTKALTVTRGQSKGTTTPVRDI